MKAAQRRVLFCLLLVLGVLASAVSAFAKSAEMTLVPTRVVLENNDRYATVTVKNSGDGTGRYRIELVDATMQEDGGVKLLDNGVRDPFSALDILSISPRSMTLKPDEFQTIRILVKNPGSLAPGEYRSHLKVKMTENDLDSEAGPSSAEAASIQLKPKLVMVIPLIIRHGETNYQVRIDSAAFAPAAGDVPPHVNLVFGFDGNRSVIGDVKIVHVAENGGQTTLKFFPGVAIYRGTAKRSLAVPLEVPAGVDPRKGKIIISYLTQEKEGAAPMAQKEFTP
ncbi:MAG: hypothetical protein AB7H77_03080 [Bdellovibrionales bacterium]